MEAEIREAQTGEAEALTLLAQRAKASWGYPVAWLEEWAPALAFEPDYIAGNTVYVASTTDEILGVIALEEHEEGGEIGHLWVDPEHQGRGVGSALVACAVQYARDVGWPSLRIESDPFAEPFYQSMGAKRIGDVRAPVAGTDRTLPLLRLDVFDEGDPPAS